ncbi:MAG: phosphoribosyltransferase domain-containing protein, partial [Lachnospiraceae bacterium]|nr:phosphoribosyltransferase domain-containing protein [Lachnospiraceae bacterium]
MKQWMQDNLYKWLLKECEYLKDYFETLRDDTADYIILISRRCYILYQMFAFVFGWNNKNVISDKGMWCKRAALSKAKRVIIADDIMFSGNAVERILNRLNAYLSTECKRDIAIFCRYNASPDVVNNYPIKSYSARTKRDCRKLTNRLVKSIQANGIPYAVFVYPWYGWRSVCEDDLLQNVQSVENQNIFDRQENGWNSKIYFDFIDEIKVLKESICDDVCLRVYREESKDLICTIPFAFLSNIKKEFITQFFTLIQECFKNAGGMSIADEIEAALEEHESVLESEKYMYLASVLTCSLSRVIGLLFGIEDKMYAQTIEEISDSIIRGSFSDEVVNELNTMNGQFATAFIWELSKRSEQLKECVEKEKDSEVCLNPCYEEMITKENDDKKCGDVLVDIFGKMREKYDNGGRNATKYIFCNEIMNLLKGEFSMEEI